MLYWTSGGWQFDWGVRQIEIRKPFRVLIGGLVGILASWTDSCYRSHLVTFFMAYCLCERQVDLSFNEKHFLHWAQSDCSSPKQSMARTYTPDPSHQTFAADIPLACSGYILTILPRLKSSILIIGFCILLRLTVGLVVCVCPAQGKHGTARAKHAGYMKTRVSAQD